eukprot:Phypoly_transcript_16828.p1 GENE.Phypoly_transcript_16828~~Phypoly_transcript_16828.p1  ORF type:complete len:203 (+),score=30.91 Phypoly_transcript_16828:81-689(+)
MAKRAQTETKLQQLIAENKWDVLVGACEQYEFESSNETPSPATIPFYGIQLFGYLLLNDLNSARFLWKRIPTEIKAAVPEFANIWKIGQAMWKREYNNIYAALNAPWGPAYQTLAKTLAEQFRQRTFALLSRAYTTISVNDAAVILGFPAADVVKQTAQRGWTHDAATNMLRPVPIAEPKIQKTGLDQLQDLTKYVVFLESR